MPDIRGKRRVCRLLISALGVEKSKDILINTRSGTFRLPNLKEAISFELYINGIYEKGLVDLLEKQIPPSGIFLDIGANIGSISISLAKRRKDIHIIAVEASPWIFAVLKENVERNGIGNITLLNKAVYSISGKTMPMYAPREYFGKGSLKPVYTHESEEVETITVADILTVYGQGKADYIKVDVEGFEKSVFEGLGAYTEVEVKPRIIFEYAASTEESAGFKAGDAQQVLISKGFQLQGLDHMFRPVGEKSANLVLDGSANIMAC
jgi:FkbM family methyltransferase